MNSSAKGVATFATDDFAGKGITLLVFIASAFDTFLVCTLFYQCSSGIKIFMADNCFVVVCYIILVELTIIFMPIEIAVRVGLLKNAIAGVLLICKNAANAGGSPAATFLGRYIFFVQTFSNGIRSFACKKLGKDTLYDYRLLWVNNDFSIFSAIPIRYIP